MLLNCGELNSLTLLKILKNSINGASNQAVLLICCNKGTWSLPCSLNVYAYLLVFVHASF